MVLTALPASQAVLSSSIYTACHEARIPVNIADVPPECDFYFGSVVRRGPVQIMVSTNGKGPRLARRVREIIEGALPVGLQGAVERTGMLRMALRRRDAGTDDASIKKRMDWYVVMPRSVTNSQHATALSGDCAELTYLQDDQGQRYIHLARILRDG